MKQTAVEWLESLYYPEYIPKHILEQAKEMEKEQIENAWNDGKFESSGCIEAEQYYNETFKSE
jgi:hypothetical protein